MGSHEATVVAERIKQLLKSKKISASKMLADCEMNKNALYTMQSSGYLPRLEALAKIADYLGCSVDYLLGRSDQPDRQAAPLTDDDLKFALFGGENGISDAQLDEVKKFAAFIKERDREKK